MRIIGILLLAFLTGSVMCHAQRGMDSFFATTSADHQVITKAMTDMNDFVQQATEGRGSDLKRLHRMVRKAHSSFLKSYSPYADFDALFANGTYDCLTATAFFSTVLTEMRMDFDVVETNYHIFIMVKTAEGEVLLETTDGLFGLITDPNEINKRTNIYRTVGPSAISANQSSYQYTFKLYDKVPVNKLPGLMHYNQAVKAYNRADWIGCAEQLEKAYASYPSQRCREFADILVRTILIRDLKDQVKRDCLNHLKPLMLVGSGLIAAN